MTGASLHLDLLRAEFAVAQLDAHAEIPAWVAGEGLQSVTRSSSELSIVCEHSRVPAHVTAQRGLRCLRVRGPLGFDQVGVLGALAEPLARAGVSIFTLSTYDTDYVLVRSTDLETARDALVAVGHSISEADTG